MDRGEIYLLVRGGLFKNRNKYDFLYMFCQMEFYALNPEVCCTHEGLLVCVLWQLTLIVYSLFVCDMMWVIPRASVVADR